MSATLLSRDVKATAVRASPADHSPSMAAAAASVLHTASQLYMQAPPRRPTCLWASTVVGCTDDERGYRGAVGGEGGEVAAVGSALHISNSLLQGSVQAVASRERAATLQACVATPASLPHAMASSKYWQLHAIRPVNFVAAMEAALEAYESVCSSQDAGFQTHGKTILSGACSVDATGTSHYSKLLLVEFGDGLLLRLALSLALLDLLLLLLAREAQLHAAQRGVQRS